MPYIASFRLASRALCAITLASALSPGFAQTDFPAKQITLVVGYPAGGAVDLVGRVLAQRLGDAFGKPVVVDNRGGASGNIGAQFVARSPADGYTLLVAPLTSYAMNSTLYPATVAYNLQKDFTPVAVIGYLPLVVVANTAASIDTTAALVKAAKAKPGSLNYGSSGNGSIEHVAGEMFKKQAGVSMVHIPYRGAAPAMTDLVGGQVQVMFATAATAVPNVAGSRVKALMVAAPKRLAALPNTPTAAEAGFPNFEVASTYAVLAPQNTPATIVQRLNQELVTMLQLPDVRVRFQGLGIEAAGSTPDEARKKVDAELKVWSKAIAEANIQPDQ
ncbi:Bug family tripartite tricarboxylate transporter substrate binding protein [Variovorax saccharolyticus]|uniref:Bug family tripartite tricarboxylate transporter substrate binding protein n=1 Tax=Variovorax saccharolyticus TaxID=3053516 RepID=UPI00257729A1|nr:tripartite tricarboxylate transporter substrate binding protein [Variovorax sp. J31P216]MDM0029546.1 tripartite tricarboxylate transporter substrate binding protein [Variovorax sp. J31P216]